LDKGIALVRKREIVLRGAVWYVTVDMSISEYAKVIGLTRGFEDLTSTLRDDPTRRQELRYLHMLAEELQGKVDNILQMLPKGPRAKRGIFSMGGRLSYFFSEQPLART
jgi:hypothetical protein